MQCWTRFPVKSMSSSASPLRGTRCSGLYYLPVQKGYRIMLAQFCVLVWCLPKRTVFIWYLKEGTNAAVTGNPLKNGPEWLHDTHRRYCAASGDLQRHQRGEKPDVTQLFVSQKRMRESCIIRVVYFFFCLFISLGELQYLCL